MKTDRSITSAAIISSAMASKVSDGDLAGFAPTGYRNVRITGHSYVELDSTMGPLIKEAFALALRDRYSLRRILAELTPRGLVSRNGSPLHAAGLRGILTNPFYAGFIRYRGGWYAGNHQPIVNLTVFQQVQEKLQARCRRRRE
jgi:site-specific DNA recombinase